MIEFWVEIDDKNYEFQMLYFIPSFQAKKTLKIVCDLMQTKHDIFLVSVSIIARSHALHVVVSFEQIFVAIVELFLEEADYRTSSF